jgi:hypothetical protein
MDERIKDEITSPADLKVDSDLGEQKKENTSRFDNGLGESQNKDLFLAGIWRLLFPGDNTPGTAFLNTYGEQKLAEFRVDGNIIMQPCLQGTLQDVVAEADEFVKQRGYLAHVLARFYEKTIAGTLFMWEQTANGTMENWVDLVIMPLSRNKIQPRAGLDTARFAAGLEAALISGRPKRLSEGYVKRWGGIADWMKQSGLKLCRVWAITAYSRTIGTVVRELEPSAELLSLIAADANSLVSILDNIGDSDNLQLLDAMNRYHLLIPLYRKPPNLAESQQLMVVTVLQLLSLSGDSSESHLKGAGWMLTKMMNISRAWQCLSTSVFTASLIDTASQQQCENLTNNWRKRHRFVELVMYCATGLARVCLVDKNDFGEPVSSLFNATVQLNRLKDDVTGDKYKKVIILRVLLGGIGLWWALRATDDVAQALDKFKGYDCLVNLTATVANDREMFEAELQKSTVTLSLHAYQHGPSADQKRLKTSLNMLGMEVDAANPASLETLRTDIETLLAGIMKQGGMGDLDTTKLHVDDMRQPVTYWAEVLKPQLQTVIDAVGGDGAYKECTGLISQLLQYLALLKSKSPAFIAEKIWPKEEMEGLAVLDTAQVKLPEAWRQTLEAFKDGPPESLAEFVREYAPKVFEEPRR